jgi:hypothetical protein
VTGGTGCTLKFAAVSFKEAFCVLDRDKNYTTTSHTLIVNAASNPFVRDFKK